MNHLFYCGVPIGTFHQTVESTSWVINHDAFFKSVLDIMVNTSTGLKVILPANIVATDSTTTTIFFTSPYSGEVRMLGIVT